MYSTSNSTYDMWALSDSNSCLCNLHTIVHQVPTSQDIVLKAGQTFIVCQCLAVCYMVRQCTFTRACPYINGPEPKRMILILLHWYYIGINHYILLNY
ncbi:unnamed protein product [Boreogadus saida]